MYQVLQLTMRRLLIILTTVLCTWSVQAQDIHFSQYFASPLTLNPALTGGFNADFRVSAIFRMQYFKNDFTTNYPSYRTISGSFDASILRKKLGADQLGLGVVFFSDQAGEGALTTNSVMASVAYHKVIDRYEKHTLTLGIQAGFYQKRIDFTKLTFESQFDGDSGFDLSIPSGENDGNNSVIAPDVTIGVLWRSRVGKNAQFYAGFAYMHLNKPKESFLGNDGNTLSPKIVGHGGMNIKVGKYITLTPGFMVLSQNTAMEFTLGTALGYKINDDQTFYFGAWYRVKDAFVPMLAYELYDFRLGVSFDASTSDIKLANQGKGAIEISVVYLYGSEPERDYNPAKFCPKF